MQSDIVVSVTPEEGRMGLVEDGRLIEYIVERNTEKQLVGSVFLGTVCNTVKSIQAAFVDIGLEQNAFLYLGASTDITEGSKVLVQIAKDARGSKGPTAVRDLAFPGRYAVLLPQGNYIGISKNIKDEEERARLRSIAAAKREADIGFVIRTAAKGVEAAEIEADLDRLIASWKVTAARAKRAKAPAMLYRELDLPVRIVRDYITTDTKRVIIDNAAVYERVCELLSTLYGVTACQVTLHTAKTDIFAAYSLSEEIAAISDRRVDLKCGGYLVIDYTEAMTVIDVNSGHCNGRENLEETIMQINREAATEIARQLRLRDIGGIIVVDFIDMQRDAHKQELFTLMQRALAGDKMKPRVHDITVLNLLEITRKKARQNLSTVLYAPCPVCQGSGRVQSQETVAVEIKRRLRGLLGKGGVSRDILIIAHPWVTDWLKAKDIKHWERELSCTLSVEADARMQLETFSLLDNSGIDKL